MPRIVKHFDTPGTDASSLSLDRIAARRALQTATALPERLGEGSVTVLAQEVISRLAARGGDQVSLGAAELADALTSSDAGAGLRLTRRLIAGGADVETVYLTKLAGAARILGERWENDALTSAQVTVAAARVYAIMRGLSAQLPPESSSDGRHAVFAAVPGEQHTLGVTMAADLFRRDGWDIDLLLGCEHDELLTELLDADFVILGLSASSPENLPALIRLIAAVRVSLPHVRIVVAGHLVAREPRLRELTDADAVSTELDTLREVMREFHQSIAAQPGAARG